MISCVIPTHGRPDYLREALVSVLEQSVRPSEIIVVSDLDDPQSRAVCEALSPAHDLVLRYVHNRIGTGASSSRNLGARMANGELLAFLDDDDKWRPNYLESALSRFEGSRADAVITWLLMFRDDKTANGLQIQEGLASHAVGSENPGVTGSNLIVTREAFDSIGGFDVNLPVKNDGDFFFRFLLSQRSYVVNAQPLVMQRKHSTGQLTGRTLSRARGLELYLEKHRGRLNLTDRRFIRLSAARIRFHASSSRSEKLKQLALGAFNSSPRSLFGSMRNRSKRDFWITDGFDTKSS